LKLYPIFIVLFCLVIPLSAAAPQSSPPPLKEDKQKVEQRWSPYNAVQIAHEDAAAVTALKDPSLNPSYVRYLSMHNFPEADRPLLKAIIDFVLNSLNPKYRKIVRTAGLPALAKVPVILRVNLRDYGIDPKAWDRLAENGSGPTPLPDPYFHALLTQDIKTLSLKAPALDKQKEPEPKAPEWTAPDDWRPALDVVYQDGEYPRGTEIFVNISGLTELYFDNKKMTSARDGTGNYKTPPLNANTMYKYTVRAKGSYHGRDYDVTRTISCKAGRRANVSMTVPRPPEAKSKQAPEKKEEKPKKVFASAPWLALEADPNQRGTTIASLVTLTETANPILRGDWFVVYATLAPAYYDMIGLPLRDNPDKNAAKKKVFLEKDFEKLMGADPKSAEVDIVAAITDTRIVTLHNRILHRFNTVTGVTGGYYWRSKDTDKGIDDQDYLNQIANFAQPNNVATEIISSGRNGMNFYFVADNKGVGLDLAAASVAQHSDAMPTRYQDKQIWVARNCMLCHGTGMIAVKDRVRSIARNKIALFIADKTKDQDVAKKIEEAFSPDFKGILELDNAKFIASVRAACDKEGPAVAKAQEELIWRYWDKHVTLERMAWDAGLTSDKLRTMLEDGINLDYTLVAVLQEPEEPVALLAWERQGFSALMTYVLGYQPKKK
jgi:uncharacterized protein (TIGR03000 family)